MHSVREVNNEIVWVGCNDRRLARFENLFPIPRGVSYNSYLIKDEKVTLMDTVDAGASFQFLTNIDWTLSQWGRGLDYLIVQHMEPDHGANIEVLLKKFPEMKIVASAKAIAMMGQFFESDFSGRTIEVKEGDTLNIGKRTLQFITAPMVHWPEVIVTYDSYEKILFSADAFGVFGALNGHIFDDEIAFEKEWLNDARRYYANIVGKFGNNVQALLKKLTPLDIAVICPLHGPIWRTDLSLFLDKYQKWSTYEPEENAVVIIYGSIYGNTEQTANALAFRLADAGVKKIAVHDVSSTHVSELIGEIFRCSHLVIACSTYNGGVYPPMDNLLEDMKNLKVQNRTVAIIENGTWAPNSGKLIINKLLEMKDMEIIEPVLTIKSTLKMARHDELCSLAAKIADTVKQG
ncbi:MAG: FprA family A-type flavoprotein [Lachnospiraceae bacterium]|nr:FprA family A-type flavoprotein [Lachnospiraceae bacterium]